MSFEEYFMFKLNSFGNENKITKPKHSKEIVVKKVVYKNTTTQDTVNKHLIVKSSIENKNIEKKENVQMKYVIKRCINAILDLVFNGKLPYEIDESITYNSKYALFVSVSSHYSKNTKYLKSFVVPCFITVLPKNVRTHMVITQILDDAFSEVPKDAYYFGIIDKMITDNEIYKSKKGEFKDIYKYINSVLDKIVKSSPIKNKFKQLKINF